MAQISKSTLTDLYIHQLKSVKKIAEQLECSENRVNYWIEQHKIQKRSISDAMYHMHNPTGGPFRFRNPKSANNAFLYGLGVGLYWGEGTKKNLHSVRLANSDPNLIKMFIRFLREIYEIQDDKLRFGLHIHSDLSEKAVRQWWARELGFPEAAFQRAHIIPEKASGTYRQKSEHGVLTVYFYNSRLQKRLCETIKKL